MGILTSLLRIVAVSVIGLTVIVMILGLLVRQPTVGATALPDGPRADASSLRRHVQYLTADCFPRSFRHPEQLARAARYIEDHLRESSAAVSLQPYRAGGEPHVNLIARFGTGDRPVVVVGAHYDAFGDLPGADDNASGVAGLLELARLLGERGVDSDVELVAYSTEEPPFFGSPEMGSAVHMRSMAEERRQVRAMICLEMIGYFTPRQPARNLLLSLVYPRHGRFIAVVGRWPDRRIARQAKQAFRGASDLQAVSYSGPVILGADLSDHRSYWQYGVPAVMITDTAYLRNPHYHTGGDTADTLDYDSMAKVVDGVLNAVLELSSNASTEREPRL